MSFEESQLRFPLDCQYRVIAENIPGMHFVIETVLQQLGIRAPLVEEKRSSAGKYLAFSVEVRVESRESMNRIDQELRNIRGVKTVL